MPNITAMSHPSVAPSASPESVLSASSGMTSQLAAIRALYQAEDWQAVEYYLRSDPASARLLVEAETHLYRVFGTSVQVLLDITPDPVGVDLPFLYARIRTGEPRRKVSVKLHRLNDEWWLDASAGSDARLEFAIGV